MVLKTKFKLPFYNTSRWSFASLAGDPEGIADNLIDYIEHFSANVGDVFDGFRMIDRPSTPRMSLGPVRLPQTHEFCGPFRCQDWVVVHDATPQSLVNTEDEDWEF